MHATTAKAKVPTLKQAALVHLNGVVSGDSSSIKILNVAIHQDRQGRYCLNDLHRAAGGEDRHTPFRFTRSEGFQALVSELTPELEFAPLESMRGGTSPGTYVCKELVYAYAMWISPTFHLKVIRTFDAAATILAPTTLAGALRLALAQAEQIEAQALRIAADGPKVEFAETICNTAGVCKMGQFAKTIGWGPNRFIERLRTDEVLMQNNLPFQKFIDRGYFRVIEKKPWTDSSGNEHPTFTTMVTGRGQEWLAKRYGRGRLEYEIS
ncbi:phage antirepressor KilAC domain-containing protein [Collimonas sp. H4R21]|uniref:Phage antirepressor KilAC domain-containing protein n=1 Tax=Collimonas rhizosphaerae TaxID=3126357 RepID=A0ABU9PTZ7_9BURK